MAGQYTDRDPWHQFVQHGTMSVLHCRLRQAQVGCHAGVVRAATHCATQQLRRASGFVLVSTAILYDYVLQGSMAAATAQAPSYQTHFAPLSDHWTAAVGPDWAGDPGWSRDANIMRARCTQLLDQSLSDWRKPACSWQLSRGMQLCHTVGVSG